MSLTLPYTTIDPFAADTVHSYTAHNTPHNRLIANDNALYANDVYLLGLITAGGGLSTIVYDQIANTSTNLSLATGTWVVLGMFQFHTYNLGPFKLTLDGVVVQTSYPDTVYELPGTSYASLFGAATKVVSSGPYSYPIAFVNPPGGGYYTNSGRIFGIAFKIA